MAKILISACLLGCRVRYNASDLEVISSEFEKLVTIHDVVSFCPEVSAGMSIPRAPAEIKGGDGFDVLSGKAKVIDIDGSFNDAKRAGKGVTAALLEQNGVLVFNQYQAVELLQLLPSS
jgi:uncharacterized protein YbbK (DUF523 family)